MSERLVHSEDEAATMIGLSARTLQRLRLEGDGPRFIKLTAQRIGYTPAALQSWLESREHGSTASVKAARAEAGRA